MEKLLNLKKENLKTSFEFRKAILKLASNMPEYLRYFCITYQKNDNKSLEKLKQEIEENIEIKNFLSKCEAIYNFNLVETEFKYKDIIYYFFNPDSEYKNNANKIADYTGFNSMEILYIAINYIDDNFPVINIRNEKDKNKILNLVLIKKYFKKENNEFLNILKQIHSV